MYNIGKRKTIIEIYSGYFKNKIKQITVDLTVDLIAARNIELVNVVSFLYYVTD